MDEIVKYTAEGLDAILSVGYRVNSKRTTKFRQWATKENPAGELDLSRIMSNV